MGRITDLLNAVDLSKENTDELYGIFRLVPDYGIPIVRFTLPSGSSLVRQRVNEEGKVFMNVSDLKYPPAALVTRYERANLPFQPMFYACSFPAGRGPDDVPPPRLVAIMETSSLYQDVDSSGIERSTVSRWDLIEDLELVALPFISDYSKPCSLIQEIKDGWNREIGIIDKANINTEGVELIMYMAEEIGKPFTSGIEYLKIASFVNYLLNVNLKTRDVDGIVYPSVPGGGAGFNVAIKPESFDKKVVFGSASLCFLAKNKKKAFQIVMNHSISVSDDGAIKYDDSFDPKEYELFLQYADGLSFIN